MRGYLTYPRICAGAMLLLLLIVGPPADAQKQKKDKEKEKPPPDYYPLKVGNTWEYRVGKEKITVRVAREETEDKETIAVLETTTNGDTFIERVSVRPDGVYRHTAEGKTISPPLCFLRLPAKAGESWTVSGVADGLAVRGTFALGEAQVTVPAGKFQTVTSTCPDFRIDRVRMELTYWLAPEVGMVKQRLLVGDREVLVELEKFTPAK